MRESAYNLMVPDGDRVLAVNLLTRAAVELSREAHARLQAWAMGGVPPTLDGDERALSSFLVENRFLVEDDFDEVAYVRRRVHEERFESRQLGLVIAPTMGCNFNCSYCFEDKTDAVLDAGAQAGIVGLVADRLGTFDELAVQWFGGEPLRQAEVIDSLSRSLLDLVGEHGLAYAATVITNGMLMDAATSKRLVELGVVAAQITLDGDRQRHDRTRRERGGVGSFDRILDNIRAAPPELAVNVRVHLTPVGYDSVLSMLDTLAEEGMQSAIASLYFAPLFHYRANKPGRMYLTDGRRFASSEEFARLEVPVIAKAQQLGFRVKDFLDVSYGICTAVRGDTLVVDADGRLMKCYKDCGVEAEAFGHVDGRPGDQDNLDKWLDVSIPRDEECRCCTFMPVCLGGCTKQWQEQADKSVICTPLRFNADERIRLYFATE